VLAAGALGAFSGLMGEIVDRVGPAEGSLRLVGAPGLAACEVAGIVGATGSAAGGRANGVTTAPDAFGVDDWLTAGDDAGVLDNVCGARGSGCRAGLSGTGVSATGGCAGRGISVTTGRVLGGGGAVRVAPASAASAGGAPGP